MIQKRAAKGNHDIWLNISCERSTGNVYDHITRVSQLVDHNNWIEILLLNKNSIVVSNALTHYDIVKDSQ
jgi:hypothetical protein